MAILVRTLERSERADDKLERVRTLERSERADENLIGTWMASPRLKIGENGDAPRALSIGDGPPRKMSYAGEAGTRTT
jgi:hypothetical protein